MTDVSQGRLTAGWCALIPRQHVGLGTVHEQICVSYAGVECRETDLSTFQTRPQASARFSRPYGDCWRPQGYCQSPRQGSRQALRLITRALRCQR